MMATSLQTLMALALFCLAHSAPITTQAPVSSTTESSTCTISIPNKQSVLHDTACVQTAFSEMAREITENRISNLNFNFPVCSRQSNTQHWRVFQSLEQNVDLLETLQTSELNVNYTEYICRMRNSVLPFLSNTLNETCACSEIDCGTTTEEVPNLAPADSEEYCIVQSINKILKTMLNTFKANIHVDISSDDLQCRVNFTARREIEGVEAGLESYRQSIPYNPFAPSCLIESSTLSGNQGSLACLQEMPAVLRNTSESALQTLAEQLQGVLPYFELTLAEVIPENSTCSVDASAIAEESNSCIAQHLSTLYSSTLSNMKSISGLQLSCDSSSSESRASSQGFVNPALGLSRPPVALAQAYMNAYMNPRLEVVRPPAPVPSPAAPSSPTSTPTTTTTTAAPSQQGRYTNQRFTFTRPT